MNLSAKYRADIRNLFAPSAPKNGTFLGPPSSLHIALGIENFFESQSLYFADRFI